MRMTGQYVVSASNVAADGNEPPGIVTSAGIAFWLTIPFQSIFEFALSCAKVENVSTGGFPPKCAALPLSTKSPLSTCAPGTLAACPHQSVPSIVPVPFLTRPERLTHAAVTFIVACTHFAYMPTVCCA